MQKFQIEVKAELVRIIDVEAENLTDALAKVSQMYQQQKIVLDADDFIGKAKISAYPNNQKLQDVTHSISKLVEYLEHAGEKDYEQSDFAQGHIYQDIIKLKNFINTTS